MGFLSFGVLVALSQPAPGPQPIVNGTEAAVCQFPTVVMLDNGCSGSLVAPNIVLTAAHCLDPALASPVSGVFLGENEAAPAAFVLSVRCARHPDFQIIEQEPVTQGLNDVGFCELAQNVTDVPPIPILYGCEVDELQVGAPLTIVGFGATSGGNGTPSTGGGTKRFGAQTVEMVDVPQNDLWMVGPEAAVCFGDSGGPALMELSDGSWRIVGVASTIHPDGEGFCGHGSIYDLVHTHLEWIEEESGVDLTPCHDTGGEWNPTEDCDAFPTSPTDEGGSWDDACGPHALSDPGALCGAPFGSGGEESTGGDTEGADTGEPTTSGGGESSTGDDTTGAAGTSGPPPPDDDTTGSSDSGTTGDSGSETGDTSGCGCRAAPQRGALLLLGLFVFARRRDRSTVR